MPNSMMNLEKGRTKETKPGHATSRKGCMRGKGGPENATCTYKGVRQRTWGKWVAEIRESNNGARLWLGTFDTSYEAAMAYDAAARKLYGPEAKLNLPELAATTRFPPSSGSFQVPRNGCSSQNHLLGANTGIVLCKKNSAPRKGGEMKTYRFPKNLNADLPEFDDSSIWEEATASMDYQAMSDPGIFADEKSVEGLQFSWA